MTQKQTEENNLPSMTIEEGRAALASASKKTFDIPPLNTFLEKKQDA